MQSRTAWFPPQAAQPRGSFPFPWPPLGSLGKGLAAGGDAFRRWGAPPRRALSYVPLPGRFVLVRAKQGRIRLAPRSAWPEALLDARARPRRDGFCHARSRRVGLFRRPAWRDTIRSLVLWVVHELQGGSVVPGLDRQLPHYVSGPIQPASGR